MIVYHKQLKNPIPAEPRQSRRKQSFLEKTYHVKSIHYQFSVTARVGKVCETILLQTAYFRGFRAQQESMSQIKY